MPPTRPSLSWLMLFAVIGACARGQAAPAAPARVPGAAGLQGAIVRCPVGDWTNVAIYGFLVRELAEHEDSVSRDEVRARIHDELEASRQPDIKPARASIIESELSHILTTLCAGTPGCVAVGLYDRSGLALALSSHRGVVAAYGVADDARWGALTAADPDGAVFPLACDEATDAGLACDDRHRLVAIPAHERDVLVGLATCIVDVAAPNAAE